MGVVSRRSILVSSREDRVVEAGKLMRNKNYHSSMTLKNNKEREGAFDQVAVYKSYYS